MRLGELRDVEKLGLSFASEVWTFRGCFVTMVFFFICVDVSQVTMVTWRCDFDSRSLPFSCPCLTTSLRELTVYVQTPELPTSGGRQVNSNSG